MSIQTQQRTSGQIRLARGPSTDRMCDSYKYAYDEQGGKVYASFYDDDGVEYCIQVNQLAHEDGSGKSHIFAGNVVMTRRDLGFRPRYASGWFHTGSREGFIYLSERPLPLSYNGS